MTKPRNPTIVIFAPGDCGPGRVSFSNFPIRSVLAIAMLILLNACVTPQPTISIVDSGPVTEEMLLEQNPMVAGEKIPDLSAVDPLELTPEMISFIDQYVNRGHSDTARLSRLLYAIMGEGTFDLLYEDITRTASETFDEEQG